MSNTPHDLHDEFPNDAEILRTLKMSDAHFQKLAGKYHAVNGEIHRIEAEVEHASDQRAEQLKKERLNLIDAISEIIGKAKAAA